MNPEEKGAPDVFMSVEAMHTAEFIVEKSRFIGIIAPVASEDDAKAFIEKVEQAHPDATHVAYAYTVGPEGTLMRASDAGEPSGTAGNPMLEVLRREHLLDVVVCGVRYFGGVKLGAGGLIRAYAKTAKIALEAAGIVPWAKHISLKITVPYDLDGSLAYYLREQQVRIIDTIYEAKVTYILDIPLKNQVAFEEMMLNLTNGRAKLTWQDLHYSPLLEQLPEQ